MKYFKKVTGDKLYLSPVNKNDIEQYTKWINDSEVSNNLGITAQLLSMEKEAVILEDMAKDGYNFAIIRTEDDQLLGNASFLNINQINRNAECGIFIGDKENRGKGYGFEALNLLINYGFGTLNFNNIMLRTFAFNKGAIACYEKVGFKMVGLRRQAYFISGGYHDEIYMDIMPSDFYRK